MVFYPLYLFKKGHYYTISIRDKSINIQFISKNENIIICNTLTEENREIDKFNITWVKPISKEDFEAGKLAEEETSSWEQLGINVDNEPIRLSTPLRW